MFQANEVKAELSNEGHDLHLGFIHTYVRLGFCVWQQCIPYKQSRLVHGTKHQTRYQHGLMHKHQKFQTKGTRKQASEKRIPEKGILILKLCWT